MKKLISVIGMLLLVFCLAACSNLLKVPSDSSAYKGMHYSKVISELEDAGFSNIERTVIEDLTSRSIVIDGAVEKVVIGGIDNFSAKDKFEPDAKVEVTYHVIPRLSSPIDSDDAQVADSASLAQMFKEAGFESVSIEEEYDLDPDEITVDHQNEVIINNLRHFTTKDTFPFDSTVRIVVHYPYTKHTVNVKIDFIGNIIFNKYDVEFYVNDEQKDTIPHGEDREYKLRLIDGEATLSFESTDSVLISGEVKLDVTCDIDAEYSISCHGDRIDVNTKFIDYKTELGNDEVKVMCSESKFWAENYKSVVKELKDLGFTNIKTVPDYDIIWGITEKESVEDVSIGGSDDFTRGNVFKKDVEVVVTYHMPYEDDPANQKSNQGDSNTSKPEESSSTPKPVPYSTNDRDTAKKGNSGIFSYKKNCNSYNLYYVINFDDGYVYYFSDNDVSCSRAKIVSGDLNDVLIATYSIGGETWSEGLHFKWKNLPDILIVQFESGEEYEYQNTDLTNALAMLNTKSMMGE